MDFLPDPLRTVLAFVVVLGVLIFVHELGHYLASVQGGKPKAGLCTLCHSRSRHLLGRNTLSQKCLCHEVTAFASPICEKSGLAHGTGEFNVSRVN